MQLTDQLADVEYIAERYPGHDTAEILLRAVRVLGHRPTESEIDDALECDGCGAPIFERVEEVYFFEHDHYCGACIEGQAGDGD